MKNFKNDDGWEMKKRKMIKVKTPNAPARKKKIGKKEIRMRALELEDIEWLNGGGPKPHEE